MIEMFTKLWYNKEKKGGVFMGCWGMGITQSDEYCEIYERFMEEYDEGKPLLYIKQDILN